MIASVTYLIDNNDICLRVASECNGVAQNCHFCEVAGIARATTDGVVSFAAGFLPPFRFYGLLKTAIE